MIRVEFPRFYFLSNDELLDLLSEQKDHKKIQYCFPKLFVGIHSVDFNEHDEIISIKSSLE